MSTPPAVTQIANSIAAEIEKIKGNALRHPGTAKNEAERLIKGLPGRINEAYQIGANELVNYKKKIDGPLKDIGAFTVKLINVEKKLTTLINEKAKQDVLSIAGSVNTASHGIAEKSEDVIQRLDKVKSVLLNDVQKFIDETEKSKDVIQDIQSLTTIIQKETQAIEQGMLRLKQLYTDHVTETADAQYAENLVKQIDSLQQGLSKLADMVHQETGVPMALTTITMDTDWLSKILSILPQQGLDILASLLPISDLENLQNSMSKITGKDIEKDSIKILIVASAVFKALAHTLDGVPVVLPMDIGVGEDTTVKNTESGQVGVDVGVTGEGELDVEEGAGASAGMKVISATSTVISKVTYFLHGAANLSDMARTRLTLQLKGA